MSHRQAATVRKMDAQEASSRLPSHAIQSVASKLGSCCSAVACCHVSSHWLQSLGHSCRHISIVREESDEDAAEAGQGRKGSTTPQLSESIDGPAAGRPGAGASKSMQQSPSAAVVQHNGTTMAASRLEEAGMGFETARRQVGDGVRSSCPSSSSSSRSTCSTTSVAPERSVSAASTRNGQHTDANEGRARAEPEVDLSPAAAKKRQNPKSDIQASCLLKNLHLFPNLETFHYSFTCDVFPPAASEGDGSTTPSDDAVLAAVAENCPGICALSLSSLHLPEVPCDAAGSLKHPSSLTVSGLRALAQGCPHLSSISLSLGCGLPSVMLHPPCHQPLHNPDEAPEQLPRQQLPHQQLPLQQLPHQRELEREGSMSHYVSVLPFFHNLQSLRLCDSSICSLPRGLFSLPRLSRLDLSLPFLSLPPDSLLLCSSLSSLRTLVTPHVYAAVQAAVVYLPCLREVALTVWGQLPQSSAGIPRGYQFVRGIEPPSAPPASPLGKGISRGRSEAQEWHDLTELTLHSIALRICTMESSLFAGNGPTGSGGGSGSGRVGGSRNGSGSGSGSGSSCTGSAGRPPLISEPSTVAHEVPAGGRTPLGEQLLHRPLQEASRMLTAGQRRAAGVDDGAATFSLSQSNAASLEQLCMQASPSLEPILRDSILALSNLRVLRIHSPARMRTLPTAVGQLHRLRELHVSLAPSLTHLPAELASLPRLEVLSVDRCNRLSNLLQGARGAGGRRVGRGVLGAATAEGATVVAAMGATSGAAAAMMAAVSAAAAAASGAEAEQFQGTAEALPETEALPEAAEAMAVLQGVAATAGPFAAAASRAAVHAAAGAATAGNAAPAGARSVAMGSDPLPSRAWRRTEARGTRVGAIGDTVTPSAVFLPRLRRLLLTNCQELSWAPLEAALQLSSLETLSCKGSPGLGVQMERAVAELVMMSPSPPSAPTPAPELVDTSPSLWDRDLSGTGRKMERKTIVFTDGSVLTLRERLPAEGALCSLGPPTSSRRGEGDDGMAAAWKCESAPEWTAQAKFI